LAGPGIARWCMAITCSAMIRDQRSMNGDQDLARDFTRHITQACSERRWLEHTGMNHTFSPSLLQDAEDAAWGEELRRLFTGDVECVAAWLRCAVNPQDDLVGLPPGSDPRLTVHLRFFDFV